MARKKKRAARYTAPERVEQIIARGELTQAALAKKLRVSPSTLRRRRKGEGEFSPAQERKLQQLAAEARVELRREARKQSIKHPRGVRVEPRARRLEQRIEVAPRRVAYVPGRIVELSLERLSVAAIFDLIWPYREQALQRGRRARREPGSFRFLMRERGRRPPPARRREARASPKHSAYVTRLMREKTRARRKGAEKVSPVYMTRPISWTAVLDDGELLGLIAAAQAGELGGGGWPADFLAVRIYPPGV